ncbi:MAG: helix-turn-helix domain-containing protein [Aggregatilineales bacterium]
MKRDPRSSQRAERILDAATDLFARYGYDKTTMDDIAAASGVSKGALYLEFAGKEALFDALLLRQMKWATQTMLERVAADERGLSLFTIYLHSLAVAAENPLLRALYTQDRRVLGDFVRRLSGGSTYRQLFGAAVDFVRAFQSAGLIRDDYSPDLIAYVITALRYGLLTIDEVAAGGPLPTLEEVGPLISDFLQSGLEPKSLTDADRAAGQQALRVLFERAIMTWEAKIMHSTDRDGGAQE